MSIERLSSTRVSNPYKSPDSVDTTTRQMLRTFTFRVQAYVLLHPIIIILCFFLAATSRLSPETMQWIVSMRPMQFFFFPLAFSTILFPIASLYLLIRGLMKQSQQLVLLAAIDMAFSVTCIFLLCSVI